MSAELDPKLREFFDSVPSYHKMMRDRREQSISSLTLGLVMPLTIDDLTVFVYQTGQAVVGTKFNDGSTHYGVIGLSAAPINKMTYYVGSGKTIEDLGEEGVKVSKQFAYELKKSIFGELPVSDDDLREEFEVAAGKIKGPLIYMAKGSVFGDFIEQYEKFEEWDYCTELDGDGSEAENKTTGSIERVLELELYFNLERYLRRKGFLNADEMLNPKVRFFPDNGRLILEIMTDDKYFYHFLILGREDESSPSQLLVLKEEGAVE